MPTECIPESFDFGTAEGRRIIAAFDAGRVTSDAGALLLGAADKAIGLVDRLTACFSDDRRGDLVEHRLPTLIGQRVFAIALGYEDLVDHDELRHDPVLAAFVREAGGQTRGLRAARRQVDLEPAGARSERSGDALSQDRARWASDRTPVGGSVPRRPCRAAARDRARSRRDR